MKAKKTIQQQRKQEYWSWKIVQFIMLVGALLVAHKIYKEHQEEKEVQAYFSLAQVNTDLYFSAKDHHPAYKEGEEVTLFIDEPNNCVQILGEEEWEYINEIPFNLLDSFFTQKSINDLED